MIIQCPGCGYSGRIPGSALGGSHFATCPKCRYRFALRASILTASLSHEHGFSAQAEAEHARDDAGSSSYELRAIFDDGQTDDEAFAAEPPAGEIVKDGDVNPLLEQERPVPPVPPPSEFIERATTPSGPPAVVGGEPARDHRVKDPWHSRLLQVWGVVLLAWAAFILSRDLLLRTNLQGRDSPGSGLLVAKVVSVLLLVAGAAGLFLAVDYGRTLRAGIRQPGAHAGRSRPALPRALGQRLRQSWYRTAHTAQPARS
jgi:hypothetical protein